MYKRQNQYIGKANGMDDEIVVRVTMDGDKIADVEVPVSYTHLEQALPA